MKPIIFFSLIFFLLFLTLGCLKEDLNNSPKKEVQIVPEYQEFDIKLLANTDLRNGNQPDNMVHLQSLSYENTWLSQNVKDTPIKHVLFNKSKIVNIIFSNGLYPDINYDGNTWRHYTIRINYTDNSSETLTGYVKGTFAPFIYEPNGQNYLTNNHISNYVVWEQNLSIEPIIDTHEYRNSNPRIYTWNIYYFHSGSLIHITSKPMYPPNARTNVFTIMHLD